jgi:lipopolysaccharide/colanic/teichoic acid biosynthesis glycosyltransferase
MQVRIKYLLDRVASLVLLALLSPLFAAIALAIKLCDRGPVFFRQQRPGLNGELFSVWKFRTMIPDADKHLTASGRVTVSNRVTPVGRWLRAMSLDELPQLINIARGEMSFIGPRPLSMEHLPKLTAAQRERFAMRPGVTGLAQVNGRNTLKWSKRIEFDIQYIRSYSLWLDLKIICKTVRVVLTGDGIVLDRNPDDVDDLGPAIPAARKAA